MKHTFLLLLLAFTLGCCSNDDEPKDPIIGKWYLKQFYRNDSIQVLSDCALLKSIEFMSNRYCTEEYFKMDTISNHCISSGTYGGKWENNNNKYTIDNGSLMNQNHKVNLNNNKVYYSYEGWNFTSNGIVTSQILLIYQK